MTRRAVVTREDRLRCRAVSRGNAGNERPSHEAAAQGGTEVSQNADDFTEIASAAAQVVQMLEAGLEILQAAQTCIPAPALEEIAAIRTGKRPLTQAAFLLGLLQRAIVNAENLVSDLRSVDMETLSNLQDLRLSMLELNAIEEAVAERSRS